LSDSAAAARSVDAEPATKPAKHVVTVQQSPSAGTSTGRKERHVLSSKVDRKVRTQDPRRRLRHVAHDRLVANIIELPGDHSHAEGTAAWKADVAPGDIVPKLFCRARFVDAASPSLYVINDTTNPQQRY
jgi:hypothetical protein